MVMVRTPKPGHRKDTAMAARKNTHVPRGGHAAAGTQPTALEAQPASPSRIAVIGSRDFSDARMVAAIMGEYLPHIRLLISGGAEGADRAGARWARKNGIETLVFHPDHKKYRHPYHHRNRLIVEAAELVVAFWNGHSTGTAYTVEYARRLGRPCRVVKV